MAQKYDSTVDSRPVKRFFVEMLTRDIALEDAILDLLDNCVDGVQRTIDKQVRASATPYAGYEAVIEISDSGFSISDNCGGIPWSEHDRAFRMGRPSSNIQQQQKDMLLVGAYGIGMKRAIFKMGVEATISTKTGTDAYEVVVPKGWTEKPDDWNLQVVTPKIKLSRPGTTIRITNLNPATAGRFKSANFVDDLIDKVETHYSVILTKGFKVVINTRETVPKKIGVRFAEDKGKGADKDVIRPYVFRSNPEPNLEVFVAVGLREPIPDAETTLDEQESPSYSTDYAGWTIICNDRVVLYCNRDELTGWGTGNIPRYHTQFIAISGIVEFKGDPSKLPTTTTKRGLEFSSTLYQQVLNRMREGTRMFVDFTNWWKQNEIVVRQKIIPVPSKSLVELKAPATLRMLSFSTTRTGLPGEIYKPSLPRPPSDNDELRVSFYRPRSDVIDLAEFLIPTEDLSDRQIASALGEYLFDEAAVVHGVVKKSKKKR